MYFMYCKDGAVYMLFIVFSETGQLVDINLTGPQYNHNFTRETNYTVCSYRVVLL